MKNKGLFWLVLIGIIVLICLQYNNKIVDYIKIYSSKEEKVVYYSFGNSKKKEDKIDYNQYTFDTEYYIYYGYLSINEKELYRQLYANVIRYNKTFVPSVKVNIDRLKVVIESLYNDHPELFYLDTNYSYKYDNDDIVVEITMKYNDTINNIESNKKLFNEQLNKIVSYASKYDSDYEKEKYVYNYLLNNVSYNNDALLNQSAYSALVIGESVCAGYARAFQLIMQKLEVPTYYVLGYTKEEHAWNIVKLDKEYYNIDITWDDTGIKYSHFNITDREIETTHKREGISELLPYCDYYTYYRYQ